MNLPFFSSQTAESPDGLATFGDMWTHVFIWCAASSILFYTMAGALAFFTLGKHKFGRYESFIFKLIIFLLQMLSNIWKMFDVEHSGTFFYRYYSLLIFLMGFVIPLTLGALSSATITFVYKASSFRMDETHAMMWGCGQTVVHASFGITRILATL